MYSRVNHPVPPGRIASFYVIPGTSCQATLMRPSGTMKGHHDPGRHVKLAKLFFVLAPLSGEKYHGDTEITKVRFERGRNEARPYQRSVRAKFHLGLVAPTRFNASNASIRPVRPFSIR
jgi:hypothetical protein